MRSARIHLLILIAFLICLLHYCKRVWKFYHPWIDGSELREIFKKPFPRESSVTVSGDIKVNQLNGVHLFLTVSSPPAVVQAVTLIKSLLYYQGRVKANRRDCSVKTGRFSSLQYLPRNRSGHPRPAPLVLHFVADAVSRRRISEFFDVLELANVVFYLYRLEFYWDFFSQLPVRHYAGTSALFKLTVPYIVPSFIDKIIVFDVDILVNEDISELWMQFNNFKDGQVLGAVCEQIIGCPGSCPSNDKMPVFGINSGVMLMDLKGMRRKDWWTLWTEGAKTVVGRKGYMDNADQATINSVLNKHSELFHSLPCAWNVQVFKATGVDCCPVFWTDRDPSEGSVIVGTDSSDPYRPQMALAVHFNIRRKPVYVLASMESALDTFRPEEKLSVHHLRHRYYQAFSKFRNLPANCIL